MSLIDESYFVNDIALPNLDRIENTWQDVMDRYEADILKDLLGYKLYKAFEVVIAAGAPYPTEWDDFINGAEFTFEFCGETVTEYWNGLLNDDKESLISYFVYYDYRNYSISSTTSINDVQGIPENAVKVNDSRKIVNAYNNGLELYGEIPVWCYFHKYDKTYEHYDDKPSAFNFLNANRADYPDWVFLPKIRINEFGI